MNTFQMGHCEGCMVINLDNRITLKALIVGIKHCEKHNIPCETMYEAVEKVTGKTWKEISGLAE